MAEISLGTVDWIILITVVFSTLISIKRGFVKEALSLVTLVLAMVVSWAFGPQLSTLLTEYIEMPLVRHAVAYIGLFFATLIVGGLVNSMVVQVIRIAGLGGIDRTLGLLFGFARGVLIMVVIFAVLARFGLAEQVWWQESQFIPEFVALGDWLQMMGWDNAAEQLNRDQSS